MVFLAEIIVTVNEKGGTGKTTTAAALAQAAAKDGRRVLAIDMDPQRNLSFCLKADTRKAGSLQLLSGISAAGLIQPDRAGGVDCIAASEDLAALQTGEGSGRRLKNALRIVRDHYDFIFLDIPPTGGELQYNALLAATGAIIPVTADTYGLQGFYSTLRKIERMQEANKKLRVLGMVVTMYDGRSNYSKDFLDAAKRAAAAADVPFLGVVRYGKPLSEAASLQKSIYSYKPKSAGAVDYMSIYNAMMAGI